MLHIQVRDARINAGISRAEPARRAGISRARLVKFEETGASITVDTLTAILEQLPMVTLTIGNATIVRGDARVRRCKRRIRGWVDENESVESFGDALIEFARSVIAESTSTQVETPATPAEVDIDSILSSLPPIPKPDMR
ncbi:MAG TPA: helix-turn-helix transcriptional regulator [Thermoanaerobaculia bacterium]|nr:helix-turn-helix transcriptional regulator [Thermoanaerobaculia bacterium]